MLSSHRSHIELGIGMVVCSSGTGGEVVSCPQVLSLSSVLGYSGKHAWPYVFTYKEKEDFPVYFHLNHAIIGEGKVNMLTAQSMVLRL